MKYKSIIKSFSIWISEARYRRKSPKFLKFRADMRELFNDPDIFND